MFLNEHGDCTTVHKPNVRQATELLSFQMNLASERLNVLSCIYMTEVEA